jgi:hypothetical protein
MPVWNLSMSKNTRISSLFAPGLLQQYLDAVAAVELAAAVKSTSAEFDNALDREQRAELALCRFVKLANGRDARAQVTQPIAATLNGALVVVATCPDDAWQEIVLIVDPAHIARGESR